jgi:hypothetical protein
MDERKPGNNGNANVFILYAVVHERHETPEGALELALDGVQSATVVPGRRAPIPAHEVVPLARLPVNLG